MMAIKAIIHVLVFCLVFTTFTAHKACGEDDCYQEKRLVILSCKETNEIGTPYVEPNTKCRNAVQNSNMPCICRNIRVEEEHFISVSKLVKLARECHNAVPPKSKCGSKCV